jgi:hypothetical protein
VADVPGDRPCAGRPGGLPSGAGRISRIAGDFDGDHARDQLLAYAELDAAGQPRHWHVRIVLATGGASNDTYNLFALAGCQVRQVGIAGSGPLRLAVGASVGHEEGFDCLGSDRLGGRLLSVWFVELADLHKDGG